MVLSKNAKGCMSDGYTAAHGGDSAEKSSSMAPSLLLILLRERLEAGCNSGSRAKPICKV